MTDYSHIYDLGDNKFAIGLAGARAHWVVRRVHSRDPLGRGLPTYRGVQARKPIIPADAKKVPRHKAGRLLRAALRDPH